MAITSAAFAARYKLACFYIANHLFETVINIDPEIDLTSLKHLQRDDGFFMASLRIVEQLTAFKSDAEMEHIQSRIESSGTMYFKKSILTAVVKQGAPLVNPTEDKDEEPKQENLYDKFVVKKLYDSYFSAYVDDTEPIEYIDTPQKAQDDLVSIFELGVFESETLATISGILNFDETSSAIEAANALAANPRYSTYKHFFTLLTRCI